MASFNISGVQPLRDSIDSIQQPIVREFFEKTCQSNFSADKPISPHIQQPVDNLPGYIGAKPKKTRPRLKRLRNFGSVLPYETRAKAAKRRAEETLSVNVSQKRPCKVLMSRMNWVESNAR